MFKRNIYANYISQAYVAIIGIATLPLYVRYLGIEAYGLIGFFSMLQIWFQILDMGLTPTMTRETARFNGGNSTALDLRELLRALEGFFIILAIIGCTTIWLSARIIAMQWLKVNQIPLQEVIYSIEIISLIIALRWLSGLYRGLISGFEEQVWLSYFGCAIATARYVFIIPIIAWKNGSLLIFFLYQLAVSAIELLLLTIKIYSILPKTKLEERISWGWRPLLRIKNFSLSIAFASLVWVIITQGDKLILSRLLPLADYGYFTMAVMAASGLLFISNPISIALMPRMTKLHAENKGTELLNIYRDATQLIAAMAIPACTILYLFSKQIIFSWTGDLTLSHHVAPIMELYAIGNGFLIFAAFPYYLQFSKGKLKLHLIGNGILAIIFIPSLVVASWKFGPLGAGWAWLISNAILFTIWTPFVHNHFYRKFHMKWLIEDILPIALSCFIFGGMVKYAITWPTERISVTILIAALSVSFLFFSIISAPRIRNKIFRKNKKNE